MRWLSPPDSVPDARDKREIVEADVAEEGQPVADLLQDALGDLVALGVERRSAASRAQAIAALTDSVGDLADVLAVDLHRQRLGLEAEAVAGLARRRGHVALDLLARPFALGLAVAPLEVA